VLITKVLGFCRGQRGRGFFNLGVGQKKSPKFPVVRRGFGGEIFIIIF
jgi:hypothetical protein